MTDKHHRPLGVIAFDCVTSVPAAVVFWNDGSGTLSADNSTKVSLQGEGTILAIGFLNADADRELELLVSVVTQYNFGDEDDGFNHKFDVSPDLRLLDFYDDGKPVPLDEDDQFPAELIIPGDFNGDGVADLVISSYDSFSMYRGVPVR